MGWRKKDKSTAVATTVVTSKNVTSADAKLTVIGPSVAVEGTVRADEDMLIAGQVIGEVLSEKLITIAQSGRVDGAIRCQSITISGQVKGNVHATEQITIEQTGRLVGDITTKILTNQPGGFFEGYSHMLKDENPRQSGGKQAAAAEPASKAAKDKRSGKGTDQVEEGKKA